jgi:hypothetical protein
MAWVLTSASWLLSWARSLLRRTIEFSALRSSGEPGSASLRRAWASATCCSVASICCSMVPARSSIWDWTFSRLWAM